jgi:cob(I)alamin adenosyltransferase
MSVEFERVTTRGGDTGESGLFSGERRRKDDLLFETMGDGDELVSSLGVARAQARRDGVDDIARAVETVQRAIFRVQSMIATGPSSELYATLQRIDDADVEKLEATLATLLDKTTIGEAFVIPGDSLLSSHLDVARTTCRRYERRIVSCIRDRTLVHLIPCQRWVNRLSDYLFVLARNVEQRR